MADQSVIIEQELLVESLYICNEAHVNGGYSPEPEMLPAWNFLSFLFKVESHNGWFINRSITRKMRLTYGSKEEAN